MNDANLYEEIAKVAREQYEKSGRVEGRDLDNWLEAERIVRARYTSKGENEGEVIESSDMKYIRDERRRHKRLIVKRVRRNVLHSSNSKVINISVCGVAIETTKRLEINREYSLKINYKGNPLRLKCRVVWVLTQVEKKESGDVIPIYKAGMEFNESSLINTLYFE